MKNIKLLNLKLTNFKGIKSFELDAQGNDLTIFGANASGKTTLFDSFVWLLFDKDSNNRSTNAFNIKTLVDGKPLSKVNHEVEAVLLVDEKEVTLKKVYKEMWTKKRGALTDTFTGHTTDYYVNGVPMKKKEYEDEIQELVKENIFRLLTDPNYFNSLHWKERRDELFEIAGDVSDDDVIKSNSELKELSEFLKGNSVEDHKKIVAARRTEINKAIKDIPIRIDEINRNLPDTSKLDEKDIQSAITKKESEIDAKNKELNDTKNGSGSIELNKQISGLEIKRNELASKHESEQKQELYKLQTRLGEEESNLSILRDSIRPLIDNKKLNEQLIETKKEQMNQLRVDFTKYKKQYEEESAKEFDNHALTCPTCSQNLPKEDVEKAQEQFNANKSKELEEINELMEAINPRGVELKNEVEQLRSASEPIDKDIEKITEQGKKKDKDIAKLKENVAKEQEKIVDVTKNKEYITLTKQINELKEKSLNALDNIAESVNKIESDIKVIKADTEELKLDLSKFEQVENSNKRIKELEDEERLLAKEYESLEKQLYLLEEFTRKKVNMLTESINSKFKYARFKLFNENINGRLEETCETNYKDVPFSSGLNNAARINVGLDIINTLSNHYQVQAPIFVDNAESVTDLIKTDAQMISLVVSKEDEVLRVDNKLKGDR